MEAMTEGNFVYPQSKHVVIFINDLFSVERVEGGREKMFSLRNTGSCTPPSSTHSGDNS